MPSTTAASEIVSGLGLCRHRLRGRHGGADIRRRDTPSVEQHRDLRRRGDLAGRHQGELIEQVLRVLHYACDFPGDAADGPGAPDREMEV